MGRVVRVNEGPGAGARAYHVGRPRMVPIGKKNFRCPDSCDVGNALFTRLHRIDAKVSLAMADQVTVEVVSMRFGEPRPRKDIGDDFVHG